jgi:hypothetical protein
VFATPRRSIEAGKALTRLKSWRDLYGARTIATMLLCAVLALLPVLLKRWSELRQTERADGGGWLPARLAARARGLSVCLAHARAPAAAAGTLGRWARACASAAASPGEWRAQALRAWRSAAARVRRRLARGDGPGAPRQAPRGDPVPNGGDVMRCAVP